MISLFPLALGKLFYGKFDIATQFFRKPHKLKFLGLFCGVAVSYTHLTLPTTERV